MEPIDFIRNEISKGVTAPQNLIDDVCHDTIVIYTQGRYTSVVDLIQKARKDLMIRGALVEGTTVKKFADRYQIALSTARDWLIKMAANREKEGREFVYKL